MRRSALLGAVLALGLGACAPTRPPPDDGCGEGQALAEVAPAGWCPWPAGVLRPAAPAPAVAVRGEARVPGTRVMPFHPDVADHGPRDMMRLALTFDACSGGSGRYDERITRTLVEHQVPATIFASGGWARTQAENLKALAKNALFELGNHSYTHPHLAWKSDDRIREELSRTQEEIVQLTGVRPVLFRPPYGEYDDRVVRIARSLGLRTVEYDLPSGDPGATREKLVAWVLERAQPGSIIVMHLNHRSFATADALPEIIAGLRARGYSFARVSDLLGAPAAMAAVAPAPVASPPSAGGRFPEEQLGDVRSHKAVQPADLPVPVPGVEPLGAPVEVRHQ